MPQQLDYATPREREPERAREIVIGGIVGAVFGLFFSPLAFIPAVALRGSMLADGSVGVSFLGAMQFVVYGAFWGVAAVHGRGRRALAALAVAYVAVEGLFISLWFV
jgi:hypothetical protein